MNTARPDEGYFESFDGTNLFYRFFPAAGIPENLPTLMIVHGHGEHSGRYYKFAEKLKDLSINIAIHDLRGQGQSRNSEVYVREFNELEKDLSVFVDFLHTRYRLKGSLMLMGHSLGGLIAVNWTLKNQHLICGLILSSPCLGLKLPGFLISFNRFLRRVSPAFVYSNPVYPKHLSHDPHEVEKYKTDPLIKRKISVSLLDEMLIYARYIQDVKQYDLSIPFYLLLAGDERIVDGEKSLDFYDKVQAPLKEKFIFKDFYHEIFNETGQDQAFKCLADSIHSILSFDKKHPQ